MAHVAQSKKDTVKTFTKLLEEYPIIGAVNVENMPAKQLQRLREQLRETVLIKMTKRRLFYHAIDGSKKENIQELKNHLKGMPALLFTKENPFTLFKNIKKNKSQAPIKAGQIAPNDILVKAGPTPFAPGPIIGELGAFKIKTGVEDGKIAIKEDCIVAKEGEEVSQALASILARLGIEPMEIGLNVSAIYENGEILTKDVLDIDTDAYLDNLKLCGSDAFKLAMEIAYSCPDTINLLLAKAHTDAKTIATEQDILTDETVKDVLAKANLQAESLNSKLDLPAVEAKAEAPKEEKVEETKEEAKEEETPKEEEAAPAEEKPQEETPTEEAPEEKKEEAAPTEEKSEEAPAEEKAEDVKEEAQAEEKPQEETKEEVKEEKPTEEAPEEKKEEETPKEEEAALTEEEKSTEAKPEEAPEEKKE